MATAVRTPSRRKRGRAWTEISQRRALIDLEAKYLSERDRVCRDAAALMRKSTKGQIAPNREDLDEAYNLAWHQLYRTLADGTEIQDTRAWLVTTTHRRLMDSARQEHLDRREDYESSDRALNDTIDEHINHADALASEDAARTMLNELATRLTDREMQLVRMLILDQVSQAEAAAMLDISIKRVNKLVTENVRPALRSVGADMLVSEGDVRMAGWCTSEEGISALNAWALGLHDPDGDRYGVVASHLANCPRCRAAVAAKKAAAGLIPPFIVPVSGNRVGDMVERIIHALGLSTDSNTVETVAGGAVAGGTATAVAAGGGLGGGTAAGGSVGGALAAKIAAAVTAVAVAGGGGAVVARHQAHSPPAPPVTSAAAKQTQVTATPVLASVGAKAQVSQDKARKRAAAKRAAPRRRAAAKKAAAKKKAADQKLGTASKDFQPTIAAQQQDTIRQQETSIERPTTATPTSGTAKGAPKNTGSSEFGIQNP